MEKISDEKLKRELAFDQYGRYAVIRDIINSNRKKAEKFRVLDVGGEQNIMKIFLPEDEVFYLDPNGNDEDENYIKADGCDMPLKNGSFDWAVSADVFEHIPPSKREKFLSENDRVSRMGFILAAPFYSKEVECAEINADNSYKIINNGSGNNWLKEHIENGLPEEGDIENYIKLKKYGFQKFSHNNLFLWELLISSTLLAHHNIYDQVREELESLNYFYNSDIFPNDFSEPSYRKIYFIKKEKGLKEKKINDKSIENNLLLEIIKLNQNLVNRVNECNKKSIQMKEEDLIRKRQCIHQKDEEIDKLLRVTSQKDAEIKQKDAEIAIIRSSKFWKARELYLRIKYFRPKHIAELASKGYGVYKTKGLKKFFWSAYKYILHGQGYFRPKSKPEKPKTDYEKWIEKNEKWDRVEIDKEIEKFEYKPKISIITPVYNVDPKWMDKCIESVRNQFYENWELCLHDDASIKKETIECLKKWEKKGDERIKISFGKKNQHISGASNEALKLAMGEFVALLDNDDELSPDALYENVKLLNAHPEADFIYSDEDKIDEKGNRVEPFFKPDWSPDLFLSQMYTCHLGVYRKSVIEEIGGFRKGYEGSQDYDLVLRFIEKTNREKIFHIPKIIYHWRKISGSMAGKETAKDYTSIAAKKALNDYLMRNKIEGEALDGKFPGTYRVKREILGNLKVSIVIPFKDQSDVLKVCVGSVLGKTHYKNYEIILVDNQSKKQKTFDYLESLKNNPVIRILKYDKPFNFSSINNFAVGETKGEYILFLNNDIEVISEGWLSSLLEHAQRKEVGAVGAKLLYPNETLQHAGVVMGLGVAGHAFKHLPRQHPGYFFHPHLIRDYCCVTAACLMMRKKLFEEIGGFDENNLSVAFNDVDLCLKLIEKGYYNVWTPYAELYHHESLSRGDDNEKNLKLKNPEKYERVKRENEYMRAKWGKYMKKDPFYSPNLTRKGEDFGLRLE